MTRVAVLAVVTGVLVATLAALPRAQTGAARHVEGRVVADDTGDPVLNAKIGFTTAVQARSTLSGSEGRFAVDLPAGVSRVTVTKAGYARRDVTLSPGSAATEVRLARTAVITGFVVTSTGEPAPNVAVRAEVPAPGGQSSSTVATSLTVFGLLYLTLGIVDFALMRRYARVDPPQTGDADGLGGLASARESIAAVKVR